MITKYTLSFQDKNIEKEYQQHLTKTIRSPLILSICIISFLITIIDFIQSIVADSFDWVKPHLLLEFYLPYIVLQIMFLIVYCCKPNYSRLALLIQNYLFAYSYMREDYSSIEQWKYYIFLMVGAQFTVFMTGEFIEVVVQIFIFSSVYLAKLILENSDYPYSLVTQGILSMFVYILVFYVNKKHHKQQFHTQFVQSQWEQIFISLMTDKYLIVDYDDVTQSFNYRNKFQFPEQISNTKELRKFLRETKIEADKLYNLEKFLYYELQKHKKEKNIIKKQLEVILQGGRKCNIQYSIFYGVRPIVLLQKIIIHNKQENGEEKATEQRYTIKYQLLIKIAYQLVVKNHKKVMSSILDFKKFKRYCIYQNLQEFIHYRIEHKQQITLRSICIEKLINKIRYLYPDKKICIRNQSSRNSTRNNLQLLVLIFIGIIEKTLSEDLDITIADTDNERYLTVKFTSFFNEKSFQYINQLIEKNKEHIHSIYFNQSSIYFSILQIGIDLTIIQKQNDVMEEIN